MKIKHPEDYNAVKFSIKGYFSDGHALKIRGFMSEETAGKFVGLLSQDKLFEQLHAISKKKPKSKVVKSK
jgi:hypothetical protein